MWVVCDGGSAGLLTRRGVLDGTGSERQAQEQRAKAWRLTDEMSLEGADGCCEGWDGTGQSQTEASGD